VALAAVITGCVAVAAGCGGGGGGDSSTETGIGAPFPELTAPNQGDSGKFHPREDSGQGSTSATTTTGPGASRVQQVMAPFRACLSRHGVEPMPFGSAARQDQRPDPAEARKEIQARIACIPELPPKLRKAAEKLKSRYQRHQPAGG